MNQGYLIPFVYALSHFIKLLFYYFLIPFISCSNVELLLLGDLLRDSLLFLSLVVLALFLLLGQRNLLPLEPNKQLVGGASVVRVDVIFAEAQEPLHADKQAVGGLLETKGSVLWDQDSSIVPQPVTYRRVE